MNEVIVLFVARLLVRKQETCLVSCLRKIATTHDIQYWRANTSQFFQVSGP